MSTQDEAHYWESLPPDKAIQKLDQRLKLLLTTAGCWCLAGDTWCCIKGEVYGPCSSDACGGVCEAEGRCPCDLCHG